MVWTTYSANHFGDKDVPYFKEKIMGLRIHIKEGYLGMCWCGKDAKHTVWCKFLAPILANPECDLPEVKGIWHSVCDDCLKPDAIHKPKD